MQPRATKTRSLIYTQTAPRSRSDTAQRLKARGVEEDVGTYVAFHEQPLGDAGEKDKGRCRWIIF